MSPEQWPDVCAALEQRGFHGSIKPWKTIDGGYVCVSYQAGDIAAKIVIKALMPNLWSGYHILAETHKYSKISRIADDIERVAQMLLARVKQTNFALNHRSTPPFAPQPEDEHHIRLFGDPKQRWSMRTLDVRVGHAVVGQKEEWVETTGLRIEFAASMRDELVFLESLAEYCGYPGLPSKDPRLPGFSYVLGARKATSGSLRDFLGASPETRAFDGPTCRIIADDLYRIGGPDNLTLNQRHMRRMWRTAFDEAGEHGSLTIS